MADEIARKTAEDFRLLGRQLPKPAPADPFNASAPPPGADAVIGAKPAVPQGGAAAIEAALERALTKVMAGKPGGGLPSEEIIARLDEMKSRAAERDDEMAFELRNGLPGRLRREIHEQLRPTEDRLASLERQLAAQPTKRGYGPAVAGGAAFAVLAGLILCGLTIFDRPLRHWGQDALFPIFGIGLPEAQRVKPVEKKAPPLGDR